MSVKANLESIKSQLPANVKLVAVSKFHPKEAVQEAYSAGQLIFGESRVQELNAKQASLPQDIEWHLIGHLQTNKIKYITSYIHTIQSVDSWNLLAEINNYANKADRIINCLLEMRIAQEESKYGLTFDDCRQLLTTLNWASLTNIRIAGVMGMASNTEDNEQVRKEFSSLKSFFDELKNDFFSECDSFSEISMGMSHDYKIAIEEGSTIVRVGTSIFGEREY